VKFEFVVTHRLDAEQLAKIVEAIRPTPPAEPAPTPKPEKPERERLLEAWLAAQAWEDVKLSHYAALVSIFIGRRQPDAEWTRSKVVKALLDVGAPIGV